MSSLGRCRSRFFNCHLARLRRSETQRAVALGRCDRRLMCPQPPLAVIDDFYDPPLLAGEFRHVPVRPVELFRFPPRAGRSGPSSVRTTFPIDDQVDARPGRGISPPADQKIRCALRSIDQGRGGELAFRIVTAIKTIDPAPLPRKATDGHLSGEGTHAPAGCRRRFPRLSTPP